MSTVASLIRGQTNGIDHPTWANGAPILVGDNVRWHEAGYLSGLNRGWRAVVHNVAPDEITVGGMNSDDAEWEEQVSPDELTLDDDPRPKPLDRLLAALDDLPGTMKRVRTERGESQAYVAQQIGYGAADYCRFEHGQHAPRLATIRRMVAYLGDSIMRDLAQDNGRTAPSGALDG